MKTSFAMTNSCAKFNKRGYNRNQEIRHLKMCLVLQEKGKYEASVGGLKGPDDMVDFWVDLLNRYPAINGLIDPLRKRVCTKNFFPNFRLKQCQSNHF